MNATRLAGVDSESDHSRIEGDRLEVSTEGITTLPQHKGGASVVQHIDVLGADGTSAANEAVGLGCKRTDGISLLHRGVLTHELDGLVTQVHRHREEIRNVGLQTVASLALEVQPVDIIAHKTLQPEAAIVVCAAMTPVNRLAIGCHRSSLEGQHQRVPAKVLVALRHIAISKLHLLGREVDGVY